MGAVACLIGASDRYTVGLTAVGEKEPMPDVLIRLLDQVTAARVTIRVALLDKAFFSIPVMRLLQSRNVPFVIPADHRGDHERHGVRAVELRALHQHRAGRYAYTHKDRGTSVQIAMVIAYKSYPYRRNGRWRSRKSLYAVRRVSGFPIAIRNLYRRRFGIESSYRQLGPVRPHLDHRWSDMAPVGARGLDPAQCLDGCTTRRWTLAAACLLLLAESLTLAASTDYLLIGRVKGPQSQTANLKLLDLV